MTDFPPLIESHAAEFVAPGEPFRWTHDRWQPRPDDVVVEVTCCTICGSDVHTYVGRRSVLGPTVLGHEFVGRIVHLPADGRVDHRGRQLRVGDRVTWSLFASCGHCYFCCRAMPQKCEQLFKYGHQAQVGVRDERLPWSGGFATHCIIRPGTVLVQLPEQLSDLASSPANCATATVVAAMDGLSLRNSNVVVQGAGMLGLTAIVFAKSAGAGWVLAHDPSPHRRQWAQRLGADHVLSGQDRQESLQCVSQATEGHGADLVLDFTGLNSVIETSPALLRIGGTLTLVGSVFSAPDLALSAEMVVRRLLTIRGIHNYRPEHLTQAVDFLTETDEQVKWAALVEESYSLSELPRALERAQCGGAPRVAVLPASNSEGCVRIRSRHV